jgi:hypothetical protein
MRSKLCLLVVLTLSSMIFAQSSTSLDSRISDVMSRMKSSDLKKRQAAFDELMNLKAEDPGEPGKGGHANVAVFLQRHPNQADRVKLGLAQLLSSENDLFTNGAPRSRTEEDGEYYETLITVVSSLDDERTIPPLVGAMTTGGIAQNGLLKYGDKALGPVLAQLKNPDGLVRASALGMSIELMEKNGDSVSRTRIRELIRSSLSDPESVVRSHAVGEIDCLEDRQNFVPVLNEIAKTDPQKLNGKALDGGDGDEFYPVRYDARRVLRDIRNNVKCTP